MALKTVYDVGKASAANGSLVVTGHGTLWQALGMSPGDLFSADGLSVRIATVEGNTALTLVLPWPGSALVEGTYEIRYTPDADRVLGASRQVLNALSSGAIGQIETAVADAQDATVAANTAADLAITAAGSMQVAVDAAADADADRIVAEAARDGAVAAKAASEAARDAALVYHDAAQSAATAAASDQATVAADKLIVAADKADTETARDITLSYRDAALAAEAALETAVATATTQAGISTNKAGEAAASATGANTAKNDAVAARDNAVAAHSATEQAKDLTLAAVSSYSRIYLGGFPVDPATDNAGEPLLAGATYYNTTDGQLKGYDGNGWVSQVVPLGSEVGSVFGRSGAIAAQVGDYSAEKISAYQSIAGLSGATVHALLQSVATVLAAIIDTNANQQAKLDSIEAGATGGMTAAENLAALLGVDGMGSGLDADLFDGRSSSEFASATQGATADSAVQPEDLAAVATSGAYADLSGGPALGSAAAESVSAFATAAQGAKADSALQPADITGKVDVTAVYSKTEIDARLAELRSFAMIMGD